MPLPETDRFRRPTLEALAEGEPLDNELPEMCAWMESDTSAGYCGAMSVENVETVKALFAAFADRDFDAVAEILDPDVQIHPAIVGGPENVVYQGRDGMQQFWADVDTAWAEFRITPEEFRELDESILVLGRAFARGQGSGIGLDQGAAWIARLREGRIVEFQSFSSKAEALEAAGLRE